MHYDYLVVGAGLFGAVFAREKKNQGKRCLVIEKRTHIAGNLYTQEKNGIQVHQYGAHIFHTSKETIWNYVNQFAEFNHYRNAPMARFEEEIYNLPFNMNTFSKMWGIKTPAEAKAKIEEQIANLGIKEPSNLEEQALSLVGTDIYYKLIKGYTEKQWGRDCKDLPAFIIKRLPVRFIYDNNYFNDPYQGIPKGGYTAFVEKILDGIEVRTSTDYFVQAEEWKKTGEITYDKVLFTGMVDEFFDYQLGALEYRSLSFEEELLEDCENYQGNAVINYTKREVPYTRIIEHKHFEFGTQKDTVITKEYPTEWKKGQEPYYPVNDSKNNALLKQYEELAATRKEVVFGGRLGQYKYFDMDQVIEMAQKMAGEEQG